MNFEIIRQWLETHSFWAQVLAFIGIAIVAYLSYLFTRRLAFRALRRIVSRTKFEWDDIILDDEFLRRLAYFVPALVVYEFTYLFPEIEEILRQVLLIVILLLSLLLTGSFLTGLNKVYERSKLSRGRPIKGVIQIIKLFVYIIGSVIIISLLIGKSPWFFVSGIGAMTAVILLIFRDTILSFVASLQISSNDLVRIGDWIEVPTYGADGDVIDIALHTIKIQNWDKTITVIPTHKLIEVSFKNWRGMKQTGGRRIKRAIYIDQTSIKICNKEMIDKFSQFQLLEEYIRQKNKEIEVYNREQGLDSRPSFNRRQMTNIGTFRAYVKEYLKHHEKVKQGLTSMVRQLAPGPNGLPLEIYVFANDVEWVNYEAIQSDIFDHLLAMVPEFELRIFQNPSGMDFQKLISS